MKALGIFTRNHLRTAISTFVVLFCFASLNAQLAGTYKLHPDSIDADFKTFAEVADTLKKSGISDSVTINVLPGSYTDVHITIDTIAGSAADKWVIFQSSTGDSTDVTLSYNYTSDQNINWMILMRGVNYVTFQNMTFTASSGNASYGRIFVLANTTSNIKFFNNVFIGKLGNYNHSRNLIHGNGTKNENIVIEYNAFYEGEDAVNLNGISSSNLSSGNVIRYNSFYDQYDQAVFLQDQDAPIISDNYFDIDPDGKYAIFMEYCDNAFRITNNIIDIENPVRALDLYRCDGIVNTEGMIANNFIGVYKVGNEATGLHLEDCDNVKVYHNSLITLSGWKEDTKCLYVYNGGANLDIRNNVFHNLVGGYAANFNSTGAVSNTNNNDYFSNGNYTVRWGSSNKKDLAAFQTTRSPFDDASISTVPGFTSGAPVDLHTTHFRLKDAGTDLTADVPLDIDGDTRSITPCIGADEFTVATGAPLTGTITIGSDQELTTLQHVLDSINNYGISGDVTINLKDNGSPYSERFNLGQIVGADADNRLTIQPDPSNTGDVILQYSGATSGNNYVMRLMRASYVTIKDLYISSGNTTYPNVLYIAGYAVHDSILNCTLSTAGGTSGSVIYANDDEVSDIAIIGNTITDGDRAISIVGISSASSHPQNVTIANNNISNQYGSIIYLDYCNAPVVTDNFIESRSTTYNGRNINLYRCPGGVTVTGNTVINRNAYWGISIDNCDGSFGSESLVANNTVNITGGTVEAQGIRTNNSDYVKVFFNTIKIAGANNNTASNAYANLNGSHIVVLNNIFCNYGYGRAYYNEQTNALDSSNNNVLFSSQLYVARWGTSEKKTLKEWQSASGMDDLSLEVMPAFVSDSLHTNSYFIDGAGVDIVGITLDKDGITRDSPPDIGAYEYSSTLTPMSGDYTIYGTSPHFTTIGQAFDSLQFRGISGPVRLLVRSGEWEEYPGGINKIPGANSQDTIVLRSEAGNPDSVIIYTDQQASMIWMSSVSNFTIMGLTLSNTSSIAGRPIGMSGTINNLNILNNHLVMAHTAWDNLNIESVIIDSILIKDNVFSGGNKCIDIQGSSSQPLTNTRIIGNTLGGSSDLGMYLRYHTAPLVYGNTVSNSVHTNFEGIYLHDCHGALNVSGNSVNNTNSGDAGVYLNNCHATELFNGLVSNNMLRVGGTYGAIGIYCNSSEYQNLYNNSINITSTHNSYGRCIFVNSTNVAIDIVNNMLANTGDGRALEVSQSADVGTIDYNCYYSKSASKFIWWAGQEFTDLASLQDWSGKDVSSIEADPMFYSANDLHSEQVLLHQAATPLPEVTIDIDSVDRDPEFPDIGAAEFTCGDPNINLEISTTCFGDTTIIIDNSTNIAAGSTIGWDWDGDYFQDEFSDHMNDTIMHFFGTAGQHQFNYFVEQIAGCDTIHPVTLTVFAQPVVEIATEGAYCDTNDGSATVTVTNMEGPFSYTWSDGQTDTTAVGLALGGYTVAVSDTNGCSTRKDVTIKEAIEVTFTELQASECGVDNGIVVAAATGGIAPYTYVWSNGVASDVGVTSDTNIILAPGTHYVNVSDANGCRTQAIFNMANDGTGPQIGANPTIVNNNCFGDRKGSIDIDVTGGTGTYSILWSNEETSEDIDTLAAGIYNVVVTDSIGCVGAGSFEVTQPAKISVTIETTSSNCAGSDGQAVAIVSGGTGDYVYNWDNGSIYEIAQGLAAGIYSVTILDGNGCEHIEPFIINDINGPVITIDEIVGVGCTVTDNGAISTSIGGGTPPYDLSWTGPSAVSAVPDITGLVVGTYSMTLEDNAGCKGFASAVISQDPPVVNPICVVTVDDSTQTNKLIWDKVATTDVSHYNIYRETSSKGIYQKIGERHADSLSEFTDSIADPSVRSWRYKLSAVDACGNESELSTHHKTIHLTMNVGFVGSTVNLIWDEYEGFDVSTYSINRLEGAVATAIGSQAADDFNSYTDDISLVTEDYVVYYIEVPIPGGSCISVETKASTLNSTRSNRKTKNKSTGINPMLDVFNLSVYPNPARGIFNVEMDLIHREDIQLMVFDISGKMVLTSEYPDRFASFETQVNLTQLPAGIYHLNIRTKSALIHRVLIKQ